MELQWPLILFTSFMAWSAGLFATQAVYALRGQGKNTQLTALITSVVLLVVGGIAVFMHLEHWERIFNGFGHLSSGITQELIAIVIMAIVMVVYFVFLRRTRDDVKVPSWVAILAIVSALALCIVMCHSYMMPSRPAWNSVAQVLSIIGAACALGPGTMAFLAGLKGEGELETNARTNVVGTVANAVLSVLYLAILGTVGSQFTQVPYYFDPVGPTRGINDVAALSAFSGQALPWTVATLVCVIAAVACAFAGRKTKNWKVWGLLIAILAFVGALALRVVFYHLGGSVFSFYDV